MNDAEKIRKNLLALQAELQQRLGRAQSEERHEVEEGEDTTAQLWQASEIRDGMNDEAVGELRITCACSRFRPRAGALTTRRPWEFQRPQSCLPRSRSAPGLHRSGIHPIRASSRKLSHIRAFAITCRRK